MTITRFTDPGEFLVRTEEYLQRDEAAHGLILGIIVRIQTEPPKEQPLMLVVEEGGAIKLAVLRTPPRPLVLAGYKVADEALSLLADYLVGENNCPVGVIAAEPLGSRFARLWTGKTGCSMSLGMSQRIYKLTAVRPTRPASGVARMAQARDTELVADWYRAFMDEVELDVPPSSRDETVKLMARRITNGDVLLWDDPDRGGPVSMAMGTRPTRDGISVGGVYTPPGMRRKGYATACVAALSVLLLDQGHSFCILYADLSNPISNSIYQKIGYLPVTDSAVHRFAYVGEAPG